MKRKRGTTGLGSSTLTNWNMQQEPNKGEYLGAERNRDRSTEPLHRMKVGTRIGGPLNRGITKQHGKEEVLKLRMSNLVRNKRTANPPKPESLDRKVTAQTTNKNEG